MSVETAPGKAAREVLSSELYSFRSGRSAPEQDSDESAAAGNAMPDEVYT